MIFRLEIDCGSNIFNCGPNDVRPNRLKSTNSVRFTLNFVPKRPILPKHSVLPVSDENFEKTKWPTNWCCKSQFVALSISAGNMACGI